MTPKGGIDIISPVEKESLEKGITRETVVPWLRELFQGQRYEAIVEAIELHKEERGGRRPFLQGSVVTIINLEMIQMEFAGFGEIKAWEYFFKKKNRDKTWEDFIRERLQSYHQGADAFSSGIMAIKQSIQEFKKT